MLLAIVDHSFDSMTKFTQPGHSLVNHSAIRCI